MNLCSRPFLAAAISSFLAVCPAALSEMVLVRDGVAEATIVVGADASGQAREAAEKLQGYIERMSGTKLPIQGENEDVQGTRILVGRSRAVEDLGVDVPSGITYQMDEEGFVIKTVGDVLVLAGNEDWNYRGTSFAVFDFLERLGCRWFFPGDFGEVIPTLKTIRVEDLDLLERPDFRFRNLWYAGWMPVEKEDQANLKTWYDHNKVTRLSMSLPGDGSISQLAPAKKYFDSHPQIYALNKKGERQEGMLCMTSEEGIAISVETVKTYFREHPDTFTFGFAPPDGYPMCHCENCTRALPGFQGKGYGDPSLSDLWFRFANTIATEVYKEFPERWVLTNGYSNRVRLPESIREFSPNLGIQSAVIQACSIHPIGDAKCWQRRIYKQIFDRWTDTLDCVFVYDYDPGKAVENLPFPALHNLKRDMPYFKERGLWGFWTEASNSWMVTHLNYYVRSKLMWNTEADVDALVTDYCDRFYGPAAKTIEKYIWCLEGAVEDTPIHTTWGRLIPWTQILEPVEDRLEKLMAKAEEQAKGTDVEERVHILRLVQDHMMTYLAMERALFTADFQGAVDETNRMLALRDTVCAIQPGLLPNTPDWAKNFRSTIEWHRTQYEDLAAKAGGEQGQRILDLPRYWEFKTDPEDIGVIYQWYLPENDEDWSPIDTTRYWEAQGHADKKGWGYWGKAWYRTEFDIPADAAGKPLMLTIGAVYNQADHDRGIWMWVNGRLTEWEMDRHHRLGYHDVRTPIHIDITNDIRPGETNTVAVLVHTNTPGRNPRGGIHRRSFLWSPRPDFKPEEKKE
jgi:hypothetical protein